MLFVMYLGMSVLFCFLIVFRCSLRKCFKNTGTRISEPYLPFCFAKLNIRSAWSWTKQVARRCLFCFHMPLRWLQLFCCVCTHGFAEMSWLSWANQSNGHVISVLEVKIKWIKANWHSCWRRFFRKKNEKYCFRNSLWRSNQDLPSLRI